MVPSASFSSKLNYAPGTIGVVGALRPVRCMSGRLVDDSGTKMRFLLAIIVIIYLVGVGVVLSPTIRSTWDTETASALADHVIQALPSAFAWPVRAAHAFAGS
jgi:hypothetical protein